MKQSIGSRIKRPQWPGDFGRKLPKMSSSIYPSNPVIYLDCGGFPRALMIAIVSSAALMKLTNRVGDPLVPYDAQTGKFKVRR